MDSKNDVLRQNLHECFNGATHFQLLLQQHDKSHCTRECGTITGMKEVTPPRCPTLPLELRRKIKRIASITPYFDWDAVQNLAKGCQYYQRKNSNRVISPYIGRVLLSQLAKYRSALAKMPPELWHMVMTHLPSVTGRHVAEVFDIALTDYQRHRDIWTKILKAETPTNQRNFVLVGDDLHTLWCDPDAPAYLALVKSNKSYPIQCWRDLLLDSFEPHDRLNSREILFKNSKITLNIESVIEGRDDILCKPKKLFSYRYKWRSACLYFKKDNYAIRTIGSEDIVGIEERGITYVSHICGVTLPLAKESKLERRQQYTFEHLECPKCQDLRSISPPGYEYNGDNHLGWVRGQGSPSRDEQ